MIPEVDKFGFKGRENFNSSGCLLRVKFPVSGTVQPCQALKKGSFRLVSNVMTPGTKREEPVYDNTGLYIRPSENWGE